MAVREAYIDGTKAAIAYEAHDEQLGACQRLCA